MDEIYATIDLLGGAPGLFFAVLIWLKGRSNAANKILSAGLIAYSSLLIGLFLSRKGLVEYSQTGNAMLNALVHVAWPLFYLYLRAITGQTVRYDMRHLLHGLPLLLYLAVVTPLAAGVGPFQGFYVASMILTAVVAVAYSVAMFICLVKYRRSVDEFFSEATQLRLTWIRTNIGLWFVVVAVQVGFFVLQELEITIAAGVLVAHGLFINVATAAWVYVIGYFSISHPDIFEKTRQMSEQLAPRLEPQPTEEPSRDERAGDRGLIEKLERVMQQDKPYLDDQLTLAKLAEQVGVPAYLLGKVINRELEKNFLTFINEYRVDEVKKRLVAPEHAEEKIIDIAFECGFRTKSAFNAFFKRATDLTPSEYRNRNRVES